MLCTFPLLDELHLYNIRDQIQITENISRQQDTTLEPTAIGLSSLTGSVGDVLAGLGIVYRLSERYQSSEAVR